MFAKFNLELNKDNLAFNKIFDIWGLGQYEKHKQEIHHALDKYLIDDGYLDASKIEEDWFPSVNTQVFLSHSHQDEEDVIRLAGFLFENYGITSFIDSTIWGYANNLLKQIDDKYCVKKGKKSDGFTYDYDKRNQSTAHVHMILQGALAKMINRCEALVFVNTPSSLKPADLGDDKTTASPWIYSELLMANTFPARPPEYYGILKDKRHDDFLEHFDLKVNYRVGLTDFVDINLDDIQKSASKTTKKTARAVLDQIYLDKGLMVNAAITG